MTSAVPDAFPGGLDRVPPQDLDAERCVLGGMLLSADAIGDVVGLITARDFYRPAHATVFTAILALYGRGEPADPITVGAELTRCGEITRIGGASYLHVLVQAVPTAANAAYYAEIVADRAQLRRICEAGTRITQLAYGAEGEAAEIADAAQAALFEAVDVRREDEPKAPADTLEATFDELDRITRNKGAITGLSTGFADLDALLQGLHPGQLVVVAGRPGLGKSTLAMDFARACTVRAGKPALFFSLEMGRDEINMRLLSAEARVGLHRMRAGTLTEDDWDRLAKHRGALSAAPLFVDDAANLTLMEIRAKARRLKQTRGLALVVVDYLQLLTHGGRRTESRQQEVADISRSLKLLAKELAVPVIALSQLNRGPEQRVDKKPVLSDLRESGAVEQDADVVILLHREDAYDKESPRAGEADLIIAKHRSGPTATVTVAAQLHLSRFASMG
ncbi:replicative DNA helicase [Streptomyces roseicoloratus]|uniref:replicative DNA helicase n=1 Tax=Streptomyces roseicoloratus TaxID=2508722 RepID=UPI001FEB6771|nr:replicative DNA helicase [Streptomyces roseicoloratus]